MEKIYSPEFIPYYIDVVKKYGLNQSQSLVYGFIRFYTSGGNKFWFKNDQLGEIIWISDSSVNLAMWVLEKKRLIWRNMVIMWNNGSKREVWLTVNSTLSSTVNSTLSSTVDNTLSSKENIKENRKEKEDLKATAQSIFQYYKDKFWTNKRTHKRAVALTRIEQQLKTTSLKDIEKAIDLYFEGKEIREPQFIKACENFFWNEPWTKIKFIYSFLEDIKEDEVLKNTPLYNLSESELRERIWDGLEELTAFKREIMDEFKTLSKEQQESFKQNLKKVEHSILTLAWIYK